MWEAFSIALVRYVREEDVDLQPVDRFRTVNTLALMLQNGSITSAMHDAGQRFSKIFAQAFTSGVVVSRFDGFPISAVPGELSVERNANAACAVREALEAVGGSSSPAGSALWYVAGEQLSIRDWAYRQGWSGKRIDREQAKGILVAALGMLVRHYGSKRAKRGDRSRAREFF